MRDRGTTNLPVASNCDPASAVAHEMRSYNGMRASEALR